MYPRQNLVAPSQTDQIIYQKSHFRLKAALNAADIMIMYSS